MDAMRTMSALSQPTRLAVFERLAQVAPAGMASGEIAEAVGASANTMSAHLAILSRAGLVRSERMGREVIYTVDTRPIDELRAFLGRTADRRVGEV